MSDAGRAITLLASLALACNVAPLQAQNLEIRYLDVGQADAALIRSGSCTVMVDAGSGDGSAAAALSRLGVHHVDLLIASHNHEDHIGGVDDLLQVASLGTYIDNGVRAPTLVQQRTMSALLRHQVRYRQAQHDTLHLGHALLILIPSPLLGTTDDQNLLSVAVRLEFGAFSAYLTGDSPVEELKLLEEEGWAKPTTLLKAPHHGARDGVHPLWLSKVRPEVVVVSSGEGNQYGHPAPMALSYYKLYAKEIYNTAVHGEVVVNPTAAGTYRIRMESGQALVGMPASAEGDRARCGLTASAPPGPYRDCVMSRSGCTLSNQLTH